MGRVAEGGIARDAVGRTVLALLVTSSGESALLPLHVVEAAEQLL